MRTSDLKINCDYVRRYRQEYNISLFIRFKQVFYKISIASIVYRIVLKTWSVTYNLFN